MPKILENVREQLLAEAARQVIEYGYAQTTMRSVAAACSLGVGTVYNYFPSKDMLIASCMLEDWQCCLQLMGQAPCGDTKAFLYGIYSAIRHFSQKYAKLFSDADAAKVFSSVAGERHIQLRDQLAQIILPICDNSPIPNKAFLASFIAEEMLRWIMEGTDFEEISPVFLQLLKK
ncbi:MAG: TetR/AcrR family transcriptional regulator [Clostridia bacterium]|nr:TetR/AcrR family transcriptional regulator [Clostridia bacterium]